MTEDKSERVGTIKCWSHEIREPDCEVCRSETQLPTAAVEVSLRDGAALALMYLQTGFVECDHCGHEVQTKDIDAVWQLQDALASRPAAGTSEQEAVATIRDALLDSQYLAGVTAGWNAAQADDPNAALAAIQRAYEGHLSGYKEAKAIRAALQEQQP